LSLYFFEKALIKFLFKQGFVYYTKEQNAICSRV
jgi:hypothetical protein